MVYEEMPLADRITTRRRSENMRRIKSHDTKPEMIVRRLVHAMGYRYRLHQKDLPGRPDMVFSRKRKVIFIHGCFWHQHNRSDCPFSHQPKSNNSYWDTKLSRNVERDKNVRQKLEELGWEVLIIWECEIKKSLELSNKLSNFLK